MTHATSPPTAAAGVLAPRSGRPRTRRRFSPAEAVADRLRDRILSGAVTDGSLLPKIDDLAGEFGVSRAAIREASLILESEGLLTVQRGNVGGSIVHVPTAEHVAYSLGMVLQARNVPLADVRVAIERFEPVCVELCAERPDRATTVLPVLHAAHEAYATALAAGDGEAAVAAAREWHEALVTHCGNEPAVASLGMLETVWTSHLRASAASTAERGGLISPADAERVLAEHEHIAQLIAAGDVQAAGDAARAHIRHARVHPERADELGAVTATVVRDLAHQLPGN